MGMGRTTSNPWLTRILLLLTGILLVLAPASTELGHRGHAEPLGANIGAGFNGAGHGECEGWAPTPSADAHRAHSDLQFETVERASHQAHGLCFHGSGLAITWQTGSWAAALDPSDFLAVERTGPYPSRRAALPPSRGPPIQA